MAHTQLVTATARTPHYHPHDFPVQITRASQYPAQPCARGALSTASDGRDGVGARGKTEKDELVGEHDAPGASGGCMRSLHSALRDRLVSLQHSTASACATRRENYVHAS